MITIENAKNAKIFYCENCDFKCNKQSNFIKHTMTRKHKMITNGNIKENITPTKLIKKICECGNEYTHTSGLWRHKKICKTVNNTLAEQCDKPPTNVDHNDKEELILMLIKENAEFKSMLMGQQNMMMEVIKNGTHNTTNNNTNTQN